VTQKNFFKD